MSDQQDTNKEDEMRRELISTLKQALTDFMTKHESYGTTEMLMISTEVLSYELGYFEAICEAVGVPELMRADAIESYASDGRTDAENAILNKTAKVFGGAPNKGDQSWKN